VTARAERLRQLCDIREELAGSNRRAGAIGDDRACGGVRYQRQRGGDIYFVLCAVM
jgi:hypothetical protein